MLISPFGFLEACFSFPQIPCRAKTNKQVFRNSRKRPEHGKNRRRLNLMPPKSLLGWNCTECTYYHTVPGTRCAMCGELRHASRREMRAFIEGKPIPEKTYGNVVEILSLEGKEDKMRSNQGSNSTADKLPKQKTAMASFQKTVNDKSVGQEKKQSYYHSNPNNKSTIPNWRVGPIHKSGPIPIDPDTCGTWIYPQQDDFPVRQYQMEISETALSYNTLVSLPTGLGKTLIAAVVLYNYYRWFPEGKVIFLAPTLPLVFQQAEACYNIMGIPQMDTAVLTGKIKPCSRFEFWRSRRVFYCTGQTVQFDLLSEDGTSFASKVCCVVLDEAHKASGDHAYTKVIEQLELAGAKFRIVGLSATPGTSIKAIQKVVESLRAVKIEARLETDPSVAPYIHQKHSEIVIVPKNEAQKDIERRLARLLEPVLQYLKARGAFKFGGGSATLTSFQIHKACQEYMKQNSNVNGAVRAYFQAAYKLIELRNDAYQSLGCVRLKIQRLKQQPQRGVLGKLMISKEFQDLYRRVLEAAGSTADDEKDLNQSVDRFNPKLNKLTELLNEHFCRANASDKSSRAIVFSQFRDSVNEIVGELAKYQPLIRARHFVGQQGSKRHAGTVDNRLGGMKQSEQQHVIRRFRENTYNVLVCTCIGEEGLDIGEVDLIVNFDTLRSPIRMIQRTGRTGRKRDGRVICLISEGQEERTYDSSKQAEKTLMRALKNCSSFKMVAHNPMLPSRPEKKYAKIKIKSKFRMSQVGHSAPKRQTKIQNWRLSSAQEEERNQLLGKVVPANSDWRVVSAVLLRRWSGRIRAKIRGQTTQILHKLQRIGPVRVKELPRRSLDCETECVFPFARQNQVSTVYKSNTKRSDQSLERRLHGEGKSANKVCETCSISSVVDLKHIRERSTELDLTKSRVLAVSPCENIRRKKRIDHKIQMLERDVSTASIKERNNMVQSAVYQKSLPYSSSTILLGLSQETQNTMSTKGEKLEAIHGQKIASEEGEREIQSFRLPIPPSISCKENTSRDLQHFCFRLPTQDSSSSSSEEEDPDQYDAPSAALDTNECISDSRKIQSNATNFRAAFSYGQIMTRMNNSAEGNHQRNFSTNDESDESDAPLVSLKRGESDSALVTLKRSENNSDSPLNFLKRKAHDRRPLVELKRKRKSRESSPEQICSIDRRRATKVSSTAISKSISYHNQRKTISDIAARGLPANVRKSSEEYWKASTSQGSMTDKRSIEMDKTEEVIVAKYLQRSQSICCDANHIANKHHQRSRPGASPASSNAEEINARENGMRSNLIPSCGSGTIVYRHEYTPDSNPRIEKPVDLTDTPDCKQNIDPENLKCAICLKGEFNEDNPIVLCDGGCNRGFHKMCYSIDVDLDSPDPWICRDCSRCNKFVGMKRLIRRPTRLATVITNSKNEIDNKISRENDNLERKKGRLDRLKARRLGATRFVLDEAAIDSSDDVEGDDSEENMLRVFEEDESNSKDSFINDATQLTQHDSDDELGKIDPEASRDVGFHHRKLDAQIARESHFSTPVLNRGAEGPHGVDLSETSSQEGLGNMHFIRSVIQHHNEGGNAEEIEAHFRDLQAST